MIPASARLNHDYHIVELVHKSQDALDWCWEKLGPPGSRWFGLHNRIYFADPKDHMMFLLMLR